MVKNDQMLQQQNMRYYYKKCKESWTRKVLIRERTK